MGYMYKPSVLLTLSLNVSRVHLLLSSLCHLYVPSTLCYWLFSWTTFHNHLFFPIPFAPALVQAPNYSLSYKMGTTSAARLIVRRKLVYTFKEGSTVKLLVLIKYRSLLPSLLNAMSSFLSQALIGY